MTIHEQDRQRYKALTATIATKNKSRKTLYCESGVKAVQTDERNGIRISK